MRHGMRLHLESWIGRLLPAPHSGWPPGLPPHTSHVTRRARLRRWARAWAAHPSRSRTPPPLTQTTTSQDDTARRRRASANSASRHATCTWEGRAGTRTTHSGSAHANQPRQIVGRPRREPVATLRLRYMQLTQVQVPCATQVQVAACTLVRQHTRRTHFTRQRQHRHCAPPCVWTRLSEPASKPTSLPPHPPAGPLLNQRRAPPAAPYTSASDLPPPLLPSPAVCAQRIA
jgi:hypothetical protein